MVKSVEVYEKSETPYIMVATSIFGWYIASRVVNYIPIVKLIQNDDGVFPTTKQVQFCV